MIIVNDVRTGFFVYAILCVGLIKECIGTETCFSCDNVLNFSECVKQKMCDQDETCYTSEGIDENGVARHSAGCMPNKTCGAFGEKYRTTTTEDPLQAFFPNGILIGRRSTTSCFWCCSNSDIASQPCNFFPCSRKDHIICSFCDNEKEEDCTSGTRCLLGEVCSNWRHQRYIYNGGNVSKSTDMVYSKSCSPTHSCNNPNFPLLPDECWERCSAGECNTKACKPKSKLSEESSRSGPLCFNCDEISDPHLCDTFKPCDYGEVCQTLVKKKFGRNVYNLTCGKKMNAMKETPFWLTRA
ncbi:uncharacterized protein LOC125662311 [Ostrea edulis]|uniref:uncharacterized protein LOC125662311 n=1 Tax=Ostrea edulis TaxID=37623 RepID=UPI0024AF2E22|nr:uncharacterized protein LOC125662311 [Ostrea edulis]